MEINNAALNRIESNYQTTRRDCAKKHSRCNQIAHRIALGILAFLATISLLPLCFTPKKIIGLWKKSVNGTDQKVDQIVNRAQIADQKPTVSVDCIQDLPRALNKASASVIQKPKKLRFGDVRAREFDKTESPNEIAQQSIVLGDLADSSEPKIIHTKFAAIFQHDQADEANPVQTRRKPPLSLVDTMISVNDGMISAHPSADLFSDDEIVEKLPILQRIHQENVVIRFTEHGKAIILQQAQRGCTAAAAAMLIMDHGKTPNLKELRYRNLGSSQEEIRDIEKAGLKALEVKVDNLTELGSEIRKNGSAIVTLYGAIGAHVVVVDEVLESDQRVRLRDPFHGWEITVTSAAFLKEWKNKNFIQATTA